MGGGHDDQYSSDFERNRKRSNFVAEHVPSASVPISARVHAEEYGRRKCICATSGSVKKSGHTLLMPK